ncbi:hypothetical protein OEZ85_003447 [Tetradesmus obliquus]|uniref:Uncharacterized protein n=1 Tax=Tetradesmus obliquus TaxID=3088 RepID=A0ABY8UBX0_TETOB|nr:hypothetical protein OEZ85_003447 [Tetradesmus obliquus]
MRLDPGSSCRPDSEAHTAHPQQSFAAVHICSWLLRCTAAATTAGSNHTCVSGHTGDLARLLQGCQLCTCNQSRCAACAIMKQLRGLAGIMAVQGQRRQQLGVWVVCMCAHLHSHYNNVKEHSLLVLQACWNGELTQLEPQDVVDALQAARAIKDKDEVPLHG